MGCTGRIATSTDIDWFEINVNSGTVIAFNLQVPAGLDYDLELYGPTSGNPVQSFLRSSVNATGISEAITYTTTAQGLFAARIFGFQGANSTSVYTITRTQ